MIPIIPQNTTWTTPDKLKVEDDLIIAQNEKYNFLLINDFEKCRWMNLDTKSLLAAKYNSIADAISDLSVIHYSFSVVSPEELAESVLQYL
jgi:hypothetical protein